MAELGRVVLATTNQGKLADFRRLFVGMPIELVALDEAGIHMDVEETGTTFHENALLKARAIAAACRCPVLADDSGIAVAALDGEPGVHSARYAGPECDDHANNLKLIAALRGAADRRAAFVCVLVLVLADGSEIVVDGRCQGTISMEERGSNGFGYDAVFYREDLGCTFGEATPEQKNARSHRAAAVRALLIELGRRGLIALPP